MHPVWAVCVRGQGIYSYRADFLPKFIDMPESLLQRAEDLEQNKARAEWRMPRRGERYECH